MSVIKKVEQAVSHPEQRVAVFIDVQNMYYSAKSLFSSKVNFGNIVSGAVGNRKLIRATAYVVSTESGEEQPFFQALHGLGIEAKDRPLQIFFGGAKKADWDVGITVDAIRMSPSVDVIVLVSGDGDFIPLVEYLQNRGKQVEVCAFRGTASSKLVEIVDGFTDLGADKKKYLIFDRKGHTPTFKRMGIGSAARPELNKPAEQSKKSARIEG